MGPEIQLGYLVHESGRSSTGSCSISSDPVDAQEQRMKDWISHVSSEQRLNSSTTAKLESEKIKKDRKIESRPQTQTTILRGPPATFRSRLNRWIPIPQYALRNNLILSVGFLEMANACDFPANIWNQVPVPRFAAILMGIGGAIALLLMYCAAKDMRLSYRNLQLLRNERLRFKRQLQQSTVENGSHGYQKSIQACLAVNTREFGFELIDRFLMDLIMGIGCLLVGVGTLMAIGGSNPSVFMASNLLSGYIGNTPAAAYGVINAIWSIYVWLKADTHSRLSGNDVAVALIWPQLSQRHDTIKLHAIVYGLTSLVAGAGSLMTATLWYGYVMLVPCVCASAWCNWLWRYKCGYSRPMFEEVPFLDRDCLIAEIQSIALLKRTLKQRTGESLATADDLSSLLDVIERYDLMTEFCLELYKDANLRGMLFGPVTPEEKTINAADILRVGDQSKEQVIKALTKFAYGKKQKLLMRALIYRQRYLLELLGSWFYYFDQQETA